MENSLHIRRIVVILTTIVLDFSNETYVQNVCRVKHTVNIGSQHGRSVRLDSSVTNPKHLTVAEDPCPIK